MTRGIVPRISARSVGRFWEAAAFRPHRSRSWLTPRVDDSPAFAAQVQEVCDVYAAAPALHA